MNITLNGEEYAIENPTDILMIWAIESAEEGFSTKYSLDKIGGVLRATIPSLPTKYFFIDGDFTIPMLDSDEITEFMGCLVMAIMEKRIKKVEGLSEKSKASFDKQSTSGSVDQKLAQMKTALSQMKDQISNSKLELLLGGMQVDIEKPSSSTIQQSLQSSGDRATHLKKQIESLSSELTSIETLAS